MILVRLLDYPRISELLASLTLQEINYEFMSLYILPNTYIRPYVYTLPHWLYIQPNVYISPYAYMLSHILYINNLTCTYNLTHTYELTIFRSSNIPIFQYSNLPYDVAPYGSNAVYLSLYGIIWPCTTYTAFRLWNFSIFPCVTPTVINYHNNILVWRCPVCRTCSPSSV